jgi:bifunctional non-homologous end joining protein LigD
MQKRPVILDGEAVAHCPKGLPDFHGLFGDGAAAACLYAFDLIAVDGDDMRRLPLERRRERLVKLLADAGPALRLSEHLDGDGDLTFAHACRLGWRGWSPSGRAQPIARGGVPRG